MSLPTDDAPTSTPARQQARGFARHRSRLSQSRFAGYLALMNPLRRLATAALVALILISLAAPNARATPITFDFATLANNQPSYSMTNGIYTLTLLDPVNSGSTVGLFRKDSDGIYLGTKDPPFNAGFSMQITGGALHFESYVIGWINAGTEGTFSLTGGTGSSTDNPLNPKGSYDFNGSYTISPGDTVILNASITSSDFAGNLSQIRSITFTPAVVPEPSTYAMVLAGIACGGFSMWRRRRKRA